jgi:dTDP-4-dehydrorhamnose 3,5-epimerase-like enzyme
MTSSAKLIITPTQLEGVIVFESRILCDKSSWFIQLFNVRDLSPSIGSDMKFAQDNQSFSKE